MTRLLVSVRDGQEARLALDGGASLIDVKEPARGSLGAPDPQGLAEVLEVVAGRRPVSVALGELIATDASPATDALRKKLLASEGLSFAKLGLAGSRSESDWRQQWTAAVDRFPNRVTSVAVVYADWQTALAPPPHEVLSQATRIGCRALLVDTFDKSRGGLTEIWPLNQLTSFAGRVRDEGLVLVLAGSLSQAMVRQVLPLKPDYVAVRGAICRGPRTGPLDAQRVRQLTDLLRTASNAIMPGKQIGVGKIGWR